MPEINTGKYWKRIFRPEDHSVHIPCKFCGCLFTAPKKRNTTWSPVCQRRARLPQSLSRNYLQRLPAGSYRNPSRNQHGCIWAKVCKNWWFGHLSITEMCSPPSLPGKEYHVRSFGEFASNLYSESKGTKDWEGRWRETQLLTQKQAHLIVQFGKGRPLGWGVWTPIDGYTWIFWVHDTFLYSIPYQALAKH